MNIMEFGMCITSGDSRKLYMGWQKGGKLKFKGGISHTHAWCLYVFIYTNPDSENRQTSKRPIEFLMACSVCIRLSHTT